MSDLTTEALKSWAANASPKQIRAWVALLQEALVDRAKVDLEEFLSKHDISRAELVELVNGPDDALRQAMMGARFNAQQLAISQTPPIGAVQGLSGALGNIFGK